MHCQSPQILPGENFATCFIFPRHYPPPPPPSINSSVLGETSAVSHSDSAFRISPQFALHRLSLPLLFEIVGGAPRRRRLRQTPFPAEGCVWRASCSCSRRPGTPPLEAGAGPAGVGNLAREPGGGGCGSTKAESLSAGGQTAPGSWACPGGGGVLSVNVFFKGTHGPLGR